MINFKIAALNTYLPERRVSNQELADRINKNQRQIPDGLIEHVFGIKERRFAAANEQVSDLAMKAAQPIVEKTGAKNIDYMIFAAACADLIEPATSNIIQYKLGLNCPVMDVKNACNSFVSGLHTASALIGAGMYKNVLIVTGEKLSDSIRYEFENKDQFKKSAAALSFGDAGAAALVTSSDSKEAIFQRFKTVGKHWELCTIKGGGSMFPHDVSKNFFEGQTAKLKDVILTEARDFVRKCFAEAQCKPEEIAHVFTHQVSQDTFQAVAEATQIPIEKCANVFKKYGNAAAASIPLAMFEKIQNGQLKRGDKILILGLAAGVSVSFQILRW